MSIKEKIIEVLENHNLMHLATINSDGLPKNRGVDFAVGEAENIVYFITHKTTNKINEINNNNNVAIVVDHDCLNMQDLGQLKYIKASGIAEIVMDPQKMQYGFSLIMKKFPYLKDLPGDPTDFRVIKITLDKIYLTDNTVGFGNTELVEY